MTNVYRFRSRDDIDAQAARWITAMDRELNEREHKQLQRWLSQNPAHRAALIDMAECWDKLNSLSRLASLFPEENIGRRRQSALRRYGAVAASTLALALATLLGVFVSGGDWHRLLPGINGYGDSYLVTQVGERTTYALDDGSQLTLNTNSQVRLDFTPHYRDLYLGRGELHVQVAKDKSRPLRVFSADKMVEAVGTAFNLELMEGDKLELIVTEGKVKASRVKESVSGARASAKAPASFEPLANSVSVGERVVLSDQRPEVESVSESELRSLLSWKSGELIFRGETLDVAIAEVSRYTSTQILLSDAALSDVKIAGLYRAGDVDGLLESLKKNFSITHKYLNANTIALYRTE